MENIEDIASIPPSTSSRPRTRTTSRKLPQLTHHWFYFFSTEDWRPFSIVDNAAIESVYNSHEDHHHLVPTDGTRYDVDIWKGTRSPVYWEGPSQDIRRCSWFHRSSKDGLWQPYDEDIAALLEDEYRIAFTTDSWRRRMGVGGGQWVMIHSEEVIRHFRGTTQASDWFTADTISDSDGMEGVPGPSDKLLEVKRGSLDLDIPDGDSLEVDHLVFVVHGIGNFCDFNLRSIVDVVNVVRKISARLVHVHLKADCRDINR